MKAEPSAEATSKPKTESKVKYEPSPEDGETLKKARRADSKTKVGVNKGEQRLYRRGVVTQRLYRRGVVTQRLYRRGVVTQRLYQRGVETQRLYQRPKSPSFLR